MLDLNSKNLVIINRFRFILKIFIIYGLKIKNNILPYNKIKDRVYYWYIFY